MSYRTFKKTPYDSLFFPIFRENITVLLSREVKLLSEKHHHKFRPKLCDSYVQDLPQGYTCRCKPEFLDQSPHRATHPGRLCVPRPTPPPPECRIDGPNQCKAHLNEVCRLVNGDPKCACPINYQRDSSGSCSGGSSKVDRVEGALFVFQWKMFQ